jgi:hypothetical protein
MKPFREKQHTAFFLGVRHVFGVPGIAVFSAMFGFGAFAKVSGFDFMLAVATTLGLWALPGQVVFAELYSTGSLTVVFLGVFFANARFFPLAVATIPLLEGAARFRWTHLLYAQLISVITWSQMMAMAPRLALEDRLPYFTGFSLTAISIAGLATASGFWPLVPFPSIWGWFFWLFQRFISF